MSESATITKPVDEDIDIEMGDKSANGGVDQNGQKKRQSQLNESSMVTNDLIGSDDANAIVVSDANNKTRTVIDMKIIAHEMWKLLNCKLNPKLTAAFASLPVPIHNAVTKTVVYRFQRRPANLPNDSKEYSLNALFYIDLLKKQKQNLTKEPLTLIGMKCAYCADHPTHIPGSLSFISINDINRNPKILEDALHQRLLHLKNNCAIARQKHGSEVMRFFDDKYNKDDVQLKRYTKLWIKELKQNMFSHMPSSSSSSSPSSSSVPSSTSASASASSSEITAQPQLRTSVQVEPKIAAVAGAGAAAAQNIAAMAAHQRQLAQVQLHQQQHRQQQQQQQYAMLQQRQHQHQQYPQPPLQYRPGNANYPPRYAQQYLNHQQQLHQQNLLQQQELRKNQLLLQQQMQQQRLIQAAVRQQKPKQRQPSIFPRNKLVPFVELQQIYKDGWEDMTWSMFNPPYDSDDDKDDYFSSVADNSSDTTTQTNKRSNSLKESLPPLPPPKANLDYCIPIQPYQLVQCPGGVPFLKEKEAAHTSKKVRGRRHQSSTTSSINVDLRLSDTKPHDVVMPSEGYPLDLAESLHNVIGNSRFMRLVSVHRDHYSTSSSEAERLSIIKKIVNKIARRGGSFLRAKFNKAKGTSRTYNTIDKERSEYTRYRLEKGFSDILNPKIDAHKWVFTSPGRSLKASDTPKKTKMTETTKAAKTPPTKISSANDNTEGDTATTATIASKVLEVEHAPKLGLIGGYLEWNNHGFTSNPKIKFSDLQKKIENTRRSTAIATSVASTTTTTATSASTAHEALNGAPVDTDNVSASKWTIINTDTTTRKDVTKLLGLCKAPPPPPPSPQLEDDAMNCDGIVKATGEQICNKPNGKKTTDVTTNVAEKTGDNTQWKESQPPNNKRNYSETISCEETKPQSTKKQRSDGVNNSSPLPINKSDVTELFNNGVTTLTS
jgi:hypothetical protein